MFDRFTDGAKHTLNHARQEAQAAGHDRLSTGHVLLGLTYVSSGPASRILASAGVRAQDVRPALGKVVKEASTGVATQLPFSRRAKTWLENTLVRAQALGATELGSEHLLLGLLEDEENDACCALREVKIEPGDVRDAALRWVQGDGDPQRSRARQLAGSYNEAVVQSVPVDVGDATADTMRWNGGNSGDPLRSLPLDWSDVAREQPVFLAQFGQVQDGDDLRWIYVRFDKARKQATVLAHVFTDVGGFPVKTLQGTVLSIDGDELRFRIVAHYQAVDHPEVWRGRISVPKD